ncbi:MAG: hypothetical protein ABIG95_06495 [Candidatus Woesearchaeota archaeon]
MSQKQVSTAVHSPTLRTIYMVEDTLRDSEESLVTMAVLKRLLPRQVNHNTLKEILEYLEESGKIAVSIRGISWIDNPGLMKAIIKGRVH